MSMRGTGSLPRFIGVAGPLNKLLQGKPGHQPWSQDRIHVPIKKVFEGHTHGLRQPIERRELGYLLPVLEPGEEADGHPRHGGEVCERETMLKTNLPNSGCDLHDASLSKMNFAQWFAGFGCRHGSHATTLRVPFLVRLQLQWSSGSPFSMIA